jgi:hypothetical protein
MATRCTTCTTVFTSRVDGLCDNCYQARQRIEVSETQAILARFVVDCEKDWTLMDRIDSNQGTTHRRSAYRNS